MADSLAIKGLAPYDGRYELDLEGQPLTTREWGWLKRYAGYLPVNLDENTFTDPEVIAVLAIVAIRRRGTIQTGDVPDLWERLQDAPFGSVIELEFADSEDGDADGPPAANSDGSSSSSTPSSTSGSGSSEPPPSRTGSPPSATSESALVRSGS